jgi:hypothetical protein
MSIRCVVVSFVMMLLLLLCNACNNAAYVAGHNTSAQEAEKTLIPHLSWACGMPDGIPKPEHGVLVLEAWMQLGQMYDIGKTPYGRRQILVSGNGEVTGPKIQGFVLSGGLDFQLILSNGVIEIEQMLIIRTSDGRHIYLRNSGTGVNKNDVRMVMDIEAPNDSSYAWLNKGQYAGRRIADPASGMLKIIVYDVSNTRIDAANGLRISKPPVIPYQPWDYRKASVSEKQGEQIIGETVTLGKSVFVGVSKRGPRNIIPITGGSLAGNITGKILFGGADYQNFSEPATLDARYLWQADNGEIILVRNAGTFGNLVPTFEARIDGKYAWLNSGTYMSSNPEIVDGNVNITMYKSN